MQGTLQGPVAAVKVPTEQEEKAASSAWAGALVPAFELDEPEAGDMIVVVVRLTDERQASVLCPAMHCSSTTP